MKNLFNSSIEILQEPKENLDIIAIAASIALTLCIIIIDLEWAIAYGWIISVVTSRYINYFISGTQGLKCDERTEYVKFRSAFMSFQQTIMALSALCVLYLLFGIGDLKLTLIGILYFSSLSNSIWCAKLRRIY